MKLNPSQLEVFVVVVECGSIRAAARRLSLTQPAVSKRIAAAGQTNIATTRMLPTASKAATAAAATIRFSANSKPRAGRPIAAA